MKIIRPAAITNAVFISSTVTETDYAAYNSGTTYVDGERVILINPASSVTFTISRRGVVNWTAHGLAEGTPVVFSTSGYLPTGLTVGVTYYTKTPANIASLANSFNLVTRVGGDTIAFTGSAGSGHTATAFIHKIFEAIYVPPSPLVANVTATATVIFSALTVGQTVTVAGVTFTATGSASAVNVAVTISGGTPANGSVSGTLALWTVAVTTTDVASYTSTTASAAVAPISVAASAGATLPVASNVAGSTASAVNVGQPPMLSPKFWLDIGATNRWLMFDKSVTSQTYAQSYSLSIQLRTPERVDSVCLFNMDAAKVRIRMYGSDDITTVYDNGLNVLGGVSLISDSGITNWYDYFFEPIVQFPDFVMTGLPMHPNARIQIDLTCDGGPLALGACIIGTSADIGGTEYGISTGIQDYSVKKRDEFGNFSIVERAYNKQSKMTIFVDNRKIDSLQILLASLRATPTVYLGSEMYTSTAIYGFFKDFSTTISYPNHSICSIDLEGLT